MPRQGHLEAELHVLGYLKLKHSSQLDVIQPIPTLTRGVIRNVIKQSFMKVQWKLSHPMLHHIEAKRLIYIIFQTIIMLETSGIGDLGPGF